MREARVGHPVILVLHDAPDLRHGGVGSTPSDQRQPREGADEVWEGAGYVRGAWKLSARPSGAMTSTVATRETWKAPSGRLRQHGSKGLRLELHHHLDARPDHKAGRSSRDATEGRPDIRNACEAVVEARQGHQDGKASGEGAQTAMALPEAP